MERKLTALRETTASVGHDVAILKTDMSEHRTILHRVMATVVTNEEKLGALMNQGGRLEKIETQLNRIVSMMDGFLRVNDDIRFRYAVHADTLLEHDKRLKKLEARDA
jgi:hypothetical protein